LKFNQSFGGIYRLNLHGRGLAKYETSMKQVAKKLAEISVDIKTRGSAIQQVSFHWLAHRKK
jgi:hypothetical protein